MAIADKNIIEELQYDIKNESPEYVTSKWIIEKTPYIFGNDRSLHLRIKHKLSNILNVDSCSIIIVGSAGTGFSLNPNKGFKTFDESSDIDIAIVSSYYFEIAWQTIINVDIYKQVPKVRDSILDHRKRLIYYGTIATDKILGLMPFSKQWLSAIQCLSEEGIFENREIHFRLYRNHESLRAYHVNNIKVSFANMLDEKPAIIEIN